MLSLNNLKFNPNSMKKKHRVARGISGRSAGTGDKGQKARSGVSIGDFQGGQTSLARRTPKMGRFFKRKKMKFITLESIEQLISINLLNLEKKIDHEVLEKIGYLKRNEKFKLIGSIESKIEIVANAISEGAKKSIESKSGKIEII